MPTPELSIVVVSYNTRALTLACLRSLSAQIVGDDYSVVVVDNASADGSAAAIRDGFPTIQLIESPTNLGFASANNLAINQTQSEWILLLNPDTVVLDRAPSKLLNFAKQNPQYGIFGGRTLFEDGSLNPTSCWARPTAWSLFCKGTGLSATFRGSALFNPEAYGSWRRDEVRQVDIITGCFLLIRRSTWQALGGFDPAFFMYAEEADLCFRARRLGVYCCFTPSAEIIHLGGRSERNHEDKVVRLLRARNLLMDRHWNPKWAAFGRWMQTLWVLNRATFWTVARPFLGRRARERSVTFLRVFSRRQEWQTSN